MRDDGYQRIVKREKDKRDSCIFERKITRFLSVNTTQNNVLIALDNIEYKEDTKRVSY